MKKERKGERGPKLFDLGGIDFGEALDNRENSVNDLFFGQMIIVGWHETQRT